MKFIRTFFMALVLLYGISHLSSAYASKPLATKQMLAPNYVDLIIRVPESTTKNASTIEQALVAAGGVRYFGYCDKLHVLFFRVDRNVHSDDAFVEGIMHTQELAYEIKIGSTINEVLVACDMPTLPVEQNQSTQ
ncbi:MAG: hypothetical protein ACRCYO_02820 [Bacteroidia bacterium]